MFNTKKKFKILKIQKNQNANKLISSVIEKMPPK